MGESFIFQVPRFMYQVPLLNGPDCWASVTRVTEVPRTNVLGTPALHQAQCGASVADGDLRPPQLITDGDLMSPRLRGAGWDKM